MHADRRTQASGEIAPPGLWLLQRTCSAAPVETASGSGLEVNGAALKVVVDTLGAGLGRLAECNIRLTIDEPFNGEFDALRNDFNSSIAKIVETKINQFILFI